MPDIVRQSGARLTGQVDPRLAKRFYPGPLSNLRRSYAAFHAFDKAHAVADAVEGPITTAVPASFLQLHRDVDLYLDPDATSQMQR